MRNLIILTFSVVLFLSSCNVTGQDKAKISNSSTGQVISLTNETFKQKVFNYDIYKEWKFEGDLPVIVDFYATWCGPCRQLSPRIEEIAKEYAGKIIVYKVDTDQQNLLAQNMGIRSLPTLLFIPAKGDPQAAMGALPKEDLVKVINEVLLVN